MDLSSAPPTAGMACPETALCPLIGDSLCWCRAGVRGERDFDEVVARKRWESDALGNGFYWGIGVDIRRALVRLHQTEHRPRVVFSPGRTERSFNGQHDQALVLWQSLAHPDGRVTPLPETVAILSDAHSGSGQRRRAHWALLCRNIAPLPASGDQLDAMQLRNLRSGAPLGVAQHTAVVRREPRPDSRPSQWYRIGLVAELSPPYVARLADPVELPAQTRHEMSAVIRSGSSQDWYGWLGQLRAQLDRRDPRLTRQAPLAL